MKNTPSSINASDFNESQCRVNVKELAARLNENERQQIIYQGLSFLRELALEPLSLKSAFKEVILNKPAEVDMSVIDNPTDIVKRDLILLEELGLTTEEIKSRIQSGHLLPDLT
jgi:hypothetical protein